jgi:probable rRNA maturation factor
MIFIQFAQPISAQIDPQVKKSDLLQRAAQETLRQAGAPSDAELTIVISDDEQLQALNRQFLGIDAPTDVLSFPSADTDPDTGGVYLGDILISYPQAMEQADTGGHTILEELQLLVVHGVLHLLGYDHAEEADQEKMWVIQAAILQSLGCSILAPASNPD